MVKASPPLSRTENQHDTSQSRFVLPSICAMGLSLSGVLLAFCCGIATSRCPVIFKFLLIFFRERIGNIDLLLHLFMHLLVAWMCPDRRRNPQPWRIRATLCPTELPGQGFSPVLRRLLTRKNIRRCCQAGLWDVWKAALDGELVEKPLGSQAPCMLPALPPILVSSEIMSILELP